MISVALCTFNGEKFLEQQINSILNQSLAIDEIIICDDVSNDSTVQIIQDFQKKFPQIINFYKNISSLGPIKNFEKSIGLCKGEIIFLSDQDDIWNVYKVERIVKEFQNKPYLEAIFTDGLLVNENTISLEKKLWDIITFNSDIQKLWSSGDALRELVYGRNKITGATLAIKKTIFIKSMPFPQVEGLWHDTWLGIHAAINNSLGWIDEPLIKYRIHQNQQVGIGNGITLIEKQKKVPLKQLLFNVLSHFKNVLIIIDTLSIQYYNINFDELKSDAVKEVKLLSIRLNLPKNFFSRTVLIITKVKLYYNADKLWIRKVIRDIIKPCI